MPSKDPDKIRANKKRYRAKHRVRLAAYGRQSTVELKFKVITAYGGKCICCGECSHIDFLTIDHIDGGGRKHRMEVGVGTGNMFYRWLIKNNYPEGFRVLCWNCNCARRNGGICPHQLTKNTE